LAIRKKDGQDRNLTGTLREQGGEADQIVRGPAGPPIPPPWGIFGTYFFLIEGYLKCMFPLVCPKISVAIMELLPFEWSLSVKYETPF